jgi:hypothetical protein
MDGIPFSDFDSRLVVNEIFFDFHGLFFSRHGTFGRAMSMVDCCSLLTERGKIPPVKD